MTRRPRGLPSPPTGPAGPTPAATNQPAPWLGLTPTGRQLEQMNRAFLHRAVDQLERETVPESYWRKVRASRQADSNASTNPQVRVVESGAVSGPAVSPNTPGHGRPDGEEWST